MSRKYDALVSVIFLSTIFVAGVFHKQVGHAMARVYYDQKLRSDIKDCLRDGPVRYEKGYGTNVHRPLPYQPKG